MVGGVVGWCAAGLRGSLSSRRDHDVWIRFWGIGVEVMGSAPRTSSGHNRTGQSGQLEVLLSLSW